MADDNQKILTAIIKNREKILYEGTAKAISAIDERGVFDILPQHSNFISIIKQHIIVHKMDGSQEEFPCREGVLRVESNVVRVYVDILPLSTKL